ncbi:hypothetical protein Enr8_49250 [Blastopirellula retiformator]|uniref:Ankyrin repeats (3 copies) n=1 Tax=Blastopirellula retiformator TaxID=2527970 RepID=A0A5C5UW05_9BACT|nr:hypothetical protein Enr8_49250 [Blastopirellula retiformator]
MITPCQVVETNDLDEIYGLVAAGADVNAKGRTRNRQTWPVTQVSDARGFGMCDILAFDLKVSSFIGTSAECTN